MYEFLFHSEILPLRGSGPLNDLFLRSRVYRLSSCVAWTRSGVTMASEGGGWISVCVCLLWISSATCTDGVKKCEAVQFIMAGFREKGVNRTTIILKTDSTTVLASLIGKSIQSPYSWINVSACEIERKLAVSQVESLSGMVSAFPLNESFALWYTVSASSAAAIMAVDSTVVTFDGNFSSAMTDVDVDVDTAEFEPYVGKTNFTEFLRSKAVVLERWRDNCKKTVERDKPENVNVTFLYSSDKKTFECFVDKMVPMDYALGLECVSSGSNQRMPRLIGGNVTRQAMSWIDPKCDVPTARCVVRSESGWEKKVDVVISGSFGTTGRASANEAGVAVTVVVVVLVLGLFLVALFRYKGRRRSISGVLGLVRERVGCARLIV